MNRFSFLVFVSLLVVVVSATTAGAAELKITSSSHAPCLNPRDSVAITVAGLTSSISGFRIALALKEAEVSLLEVHPGSFMNSCQWEYLSWKIDRTTPIANAHQSSDMAGSDITAILEISGFASASADHTPSCFGGAGELELARVVMILAQSVAGRYTDCENLPVRFYWRDCRDNILISQNGDTAFAVASVSDLWSPGVPNPPGFNFPGLGVPGYLCDSVSSQHQLTTLAAVNGGFDMVCADSVCHRGDLNLNGIPAEVADVVMYEGFFTVGMIIFCVPPPRLDEVIAQSDVNGDGITLSVADLVYLIRMVVGDVPK